MSDDDADDPMFSSSLDELDILLGVNQSVGESSGTGAAAAAEPNPFDLRQMQEKLRRQAIVKHVEQCSTEVARIKAKLDKLTTEAQDVEVAIAVEQEERDQVAQQLDSLDGDGAQPDMRLQRQTRRLKVHQDKMTAEKTSLLARRAELEVQMATIRYELNEAEMSRDRFAEMAAQFQDELNLDAAQAEARGKQRLATEEKIARRIVASLHNQEESRAAAKQAAADEAAHRQAVAIATQKTMTKYAEQSANLATAGRQAQEATRAAEVRKKATNIIGLKKTTDLISDRDREASRARQQREAAERASLEAEKKSLLEQGLNPEMVIRSRERAQVTETKRQQLADRTRAHEVNVVNKLLAEEKRRAQDEKPRERVYQESVSARLSSRPSQIAPPADRMTDGGGAAVLETAIFSEVPDTSTSDEVESDSRDLPIEDDLEESDTVGYDEPEFEGGWGEIGGSGHSEPSRAASATKTLKPLRKGPQSALERRMLTEARERQRAGIVRDQIVNGRKFEGVPFAAAPEVVRFDNFEPGKVYRQKITLTNISLTLNNVKMLPPPCDLIDYEFTPVKALSSGMSTEMVVVFSPRVSEDYVGDIAVLAQTGPFTIPLVCTTPKCLMSVSTTTVDFGTVNIGKSATQKVVLENCGAIGTNYTLSVCGNSNSANGAAIESADARPPTFAISGPLAGDVPPQTSKIVTVQFKPDEVGMISGTAIVNFSQGGLATQEIQLRGECIGIPIEALPKELSFDVCRCGYTYARKVTLKNTGPSPTLVSIKVPKQARGYVTAQPAKFSVAARGEYSTNVTFKPSAALIPNSAEPIELDTKLVIGIEGQVASSEVGLHATVVNPELKLSHNELDFGRVSVTESVVASITIENQLEILQNFGFVDTPEFVSIEPGDGFGSLLPGEKRSLDVICSAPQNYDDDVERPLKFALTCTWAGSPGVAKIQCSGIIVVPPLRLSSSRIKFATAAVGHSVTGSVMLQTIGTKPVDFAFVLPENNDAIDIYPRSGKVDPVRGCRVILSHTPKNKSSGAQSEVPRVDFISVPCICRPVVNPDGGPDTVALHDPSRMVHLNLYAPVVESTLEFVDIVGKKLDYGQTPTGGQNTKTFRIKNVTDQIIHGIQTIAQDPLGPFSVRASPHTLNPGESGCVVVAFAPQHTGDFFDNVEIRSGPTSLRCQLRGTSATPTLCVTVANTEVVHDALLQFDACQVGQVAKKVLRLTNPDQFPVSYNFFMSSDIVRRANQQALVDPMALEAELSGRGRLLVSTHPVSGAPMLDSGDFGAMNLDGTAPFYFQPPAGTVDGGKSMDITLCFAPDHESPSFGDVATLSLAASGKEPQCLKLRGSAWKTQMYIDGHDAGCLMDPMDVISQVNVQLPVKVSDPGTEDSPESVHSNITDELFQLSWICSSASSQEERTRELRICMAPATTNDGKNVKGEFTIAAPSNSAFEVDCVKGVLESGSSKSLLVTCNVPEGAAVGSHLIGHVAIHTQAEVSRTFVVELAAEVAAL